MVSNPYITSAGTAISIVNLVSIDLSEYLLRESRYLPGRQRSGKNPGPESKNALLADWDQFFHCVKHQVKLADMLSSIHSLSYRLGVSYLNCQDADYSNSAANHSEQGPKITKFPGSLLFCRNLFVTGEAMWHIVVAHTHRPRKTACSVKSPTPGEIPQ